MGSDVEKIFEKGEEGMKEAEGFIKQMVRACDSLPEYRTDVARDAGNWQDLHARNRLLRSSRRVSSASHLVFFLRDPPLTLS